MGVQRPADRPRRLDNKLVYSAHDYPNSVYGPAVVPGQRLPGEPAGQVRPDVGLHLQAGHRAGVLGEFGTKLTDPKDAPWLDAITAYLAGDLDNNGTSDIAAGDKGVSWTFWSWNPNSGDTGGILANDWRTVNQNKMAYLTPIEFDFDSDVSSGAGPHATFVVTLSAPATEAVTVDYHTVAGTAGSADFTGASGTVTFAPGETSKTITIAITPDTLVEGNEQFTVVLSNPHSATIADGTGVGTIVDDDTAPPAVVPTLAIDDASITEGDSGTSQLTFTVKLSQAASGPVTVNYSTANGTATAGSDYTAADRHPHLRRRRDHQDHHRADHGRHHGRGQRDLHRHPGGRLRRHHRRRLGCRHHRQQRHRAAGLGRSRRSPSLADSWSSGFNANVVVHNDGSSMSGWQIVIDMPNQITDIWNAKILSHDANGYVIGPATWNGTLGHDGETSFGFVASGAYNASAVHVHGVGQDDVPDAVPTVPTALVSSAVSASTDHAELAGIERAGRRLRHRLFDLRRRARGRARPRAPAIASPALRPTPTITSRWRRSTPWDRRRRPVRSRCTPRSHRRRATTSTCSRPTSTWRCRTPPTSRASPQRRASPTSPWRSCSPPTRASAGRAGASISDDTLFNGTTILEHVQDIQAAGGNVTISFGGAAGRRRRWPRPAPRSCRPSISR